MVTKFAKLLLLVVCACALQGCATYYYSSPAGGQRSVSYDGDAENYYYGSGVGYATIDYSSIRYYPWWSMDYYYLGPHYYSPWYSRGWYAGYASGWYTSLGYNYVYPPYYRPYGYYNSFFYRNSWFAGYEPWYWWPGYTPGIHFVWYDTYWRKRYRHHAYEHYPEPVDDYYGNARYSARELRRDLYADPRDRAPASGPLQRSTAASRNVSMAPSYRSGDTGMQVRSRRDSKVRESHIGPAPVQSPSVPSAQPRSISVVPRSPVHSQAPSRSVTAPPQPVYQAPPPQARPPEPSRPVASPSRTIRQAGPTRGQRPAPRPAPSMPAPVRSGTDSVAPDYDKGGSRRRN